jgi:hypothetical protein
MWKKETQLSATPERLAFARNVPNPRKAPRHPWPREKRFPESLETWPAREIVVLAPGTGGKGLSGFLMLVTRRRYQIEEGWSVRSGRMMCDAPPTRTRGHQSSARGR